MKLSEAAILGLPLVRFDSHIYLQNGCGCLLGAGYAGKTGVLDASMDAVVGEWPWLYNELSVPEKLAVCSMAETAPAHDIVTYWAFAISQGIATLEEALDWIRQNEPQENPEVTSEKETEEKIC